MCRRVRAEAEAYYYLDHEVWGHRQIEVVRAENYLPRGSYRHLLLDSSHTAPEEDPPVNSMDRATEKKVWTDPPDQTATQGGVCPMRTQWRDAHLAVGRAYQIGFHRAWRYYQTYLGSSLL